MNSIQNSSLEAPIIEERRSNLPENFMQNSANSINVNSSTSSNQQTQASTAYVPNRIENENTEEFNEMATYKNLPELVSHSRQVGHYIDDDYDHEFNNRQRSFTNIVFDEDGNAEYRPNFSIDKLNDLKQKATVMSGPGPDDDSRDSAYQRFIEEDTVNDVNNVIKRRREILRNSSLLRLYENDPNLAEIDIRVLQRMSISKRLHAKANELNQQYMTANATPLISSFCKDGRYYLKLLKEEKSRILSMAKDAEVYIKTSTNVCVNEDLMGLLRVAVGKSRLLANELMSKFENLCHNNINYAPDDRHPIYIEDLESFWDIINIQLREMHGVFAKVEQLRRCYWSSADDSNQPMTTQNAIIKNSANKKTKAKPTKKLSLNSNRFVSATMKKRDNERQEFLARVRHTKKNTDNIHEDFLEIYVQGNSFSE